MIAPNLEVLQLTFINDCQIGRLSIALTQGSERGPVLPIKFLDFKLNPAYTYFTYLYNGCVHSTGVSTMASYSQELVSFKE